ncbi:alpha/beta hydrolase [Pseudoteredinibacter isoporae]|uniref:alpha/beta hydrolase n=1 Tax=Pseudoteredinibacter isoporae TaxID=570281 RepID=UPI00310AFEBA
MNIEKKKIHFNIANETIIGHLYIPQGGKQPYPAAVVVGPMTSVKEQVAGYYAQKAAMKGLVTLAIDHRHYGESSGEPRQYEYYKHKIDDVVEAVNFLAHQEEVDTENIGLIGVCLGCGYASWASIKTEKVNWLKLVVGYYRSPKTMKLNSPQDYEGKIDQGVKARIAYEEKQETIMIPAAALEGDAAMSSSNLVDYYGNRAKVDNYINAFAVMSREHFVPFDVQEAAPQLNVPVVMIHSKQALSPTLAQEYFDKIRSPKQMHWLEGKSQDDFYDNPDLVDAALTVQMEKT